MKILALIIAATLTASGQTSSNTTFKKALSGITSASASGPMPNIGQGSHLLTVMFQAATGDVTGIVVRIEASYDNSLFFPISEDVTKATYNGSFAYGVVRGNGNFPYVRVRAVTASGSNAMDAWYTGSLYPIANVAFSTDRFIVTPPGAAASSEPYIYHVAAVIPSEWSNVNFSNTYTSRTDHDNGVISLSEHGNGYNQWRFVCRSIPTAPYKARFMVTLPMQYNTNDAGLKIAVALRNSTSNKAVMFEYANTNTISGYDLNIGNNMAAHV